MKERRRHPLLKIMTTLSILKHKEVVGWMLQLLQVSLDKKNTVTEMTFTYFPSFMTESKKTPKI